MIEIEEVHKRFGRHEVLKGVSLLVSKGEVVVILGPSGSGKSTLLRSINGLETIEGGSIAVDGVRVHDSRETLHQVRQLTGMVFQQFNLFPHRTVLQNITMAPTHVQKKPRAEAEEIARRLLDKVGLPDKADAYPSRLSGGQQQRVAIARALVNKPRLLFADEPTGNLDSHTSEEVLRMFQDLNRDEGITVILVTHDSGIASHMRRIIRIRDGVIEGEAAGVSPLLSPGQEP